MADKSDPLVMMYLRRIDAKLDQVTQQVVEIAACMDRIIVRLERTAHDLRPMAIA